VNANTTMLTRKPASIPPFKVRHILVPTDFSPIARKAVRYARPLAKRFGAHITLLHIVAPLTCQADYGYGPVTRCILDHASFRAARRRLGSLARSKGQRICSTTPLICSGSAPDEIVNVARRLKTDLIIMGESSVSRAATTSALTTAERTLRNTPCPVIVVRENGPEFFKKRKESL
jgi:universal stress protein A